MSPKLLVLVIVNLAFLILCYKLFKKKELLSYFHGGKWWITWVAVAVITLMDELTSVFYAPSEAFRVIKTNAIFFIAFTSILMRFLSNRMVEIAHILEENKMIGGGVYNFSYLVMGPTMSFIAVGSILVDYILTASISTVSAVENGLALFNLSGGTKFGVELVVIWLIAGLNVLGIKENARVTFYIFLATALVFLNFITAGFFEMTPTNYGIVAESAKSAVTTVLGGGIFNGYFYVVASIAACILAYSGIESVLQTASLVKSWREIKKAYTFLALSVGIVTPVITLLVLSHQSFDFAAHETDLIPHYAAYLNGNAFGLVVSMIASITLIMALNTAYVASSELIERVALRYNFHWLVKTNKYDALYLVHIGNAIFYSIIIYITNGEQMILAEMYALGLVASFVINMGALLGYRYQKGDHEATAYRTSRFGTFVLFLLLLSCFLYLAWHKPFGTILWVSVTAVCLLFGILMAKKRAPEIQQTVKGDSTMDLILYIASHDQKNVHVYFKRPFEQKNLVLYDLSIYITFYSPRKEIPPKLAENHFRFPVKRTSLYNNILAFLNLMVFELPGHNITAHFGWPTSRWLDRLSIGVMTFQLMRLPEKCPNLNYRIEQYSAK